MFYLDYKIGTAVLALFGFDGVIAPQAQNNLSYLLQEPVYLFLPLLLGGVICGLLAWPVAYISFYYPVKGMQRAYRLQRLLAIRMRRKRKNV